MPGSRVLFRRSALVVLATLALSSCSSPHHVPPPTSTSTTATSMPALPSPSPSRTGPLLTGPGVLPGEKPPRLDPRDVTHDSGGALSFAAYYYRAFDWSLATNDAYLLRQISLPTCTACQGVISQIDDLAAKHQVLRGGRITLNSFGLITGHFRFRSDYVEVKASQEPYTVQDPGQSPQPAGKANTDDTFVFVSWINGGWRIVEVGEPS